MTTIVAPARPKVPVLSWHRPLMVLAGAMILCALVCLVGLVLDPRVLTGQPIWLKPLKFSLSIGIYAVTWAWLINQLARFRRLAWWAGTVSVFCLVIEQVIIVGDVIRGTTSHFNVSTPFNRVMWAVMAGSIGVVWIATLVVSALLFKNPVADRARNLAIRSGAVVAVIGMALGFLMTIPSARQITDGLTIVGSHSVGLADGGPGLPFFGWSTVGGDLRIPHFIGMHALQAIPILLILLELASRRFVLLRSVAVRSRLVMTFAVGYLALLGILTWQALRGQSVVRRDALTGLALAVFLLLVLAGVVVSLRGPAGDAPAARVAAGR
ncbi:hypothetical protein ABIB25_002831 [Nakamurella sp. UYEF19]|uniref:hypothetical protein n=1 Tax=Nakamurella sp. UYEF19 TaxID=1756392 RepID=UPI003391D1A7